MPLNLTLDHERQARLIDEQAATIARLTAANENERKLNDTAFTDNMAALNKQAEEIRTLKQMLEACALYLNHPDVKEIPFAMRSEVLGDKILAMLEAK